MGAQNISLDDARNILECLDKALVLLDAHDQDLIGTHVQMAIDLLRASSDINEAANAQIDP